MIRHLGYHIHPELGIVIGLRGRPIGSVSTDGYLQIDGRTRGMGLLSVHRVIWESVHGPIPEGMQINHINGVKADNRISNLELVTQSENMRHAFALGLKTHEGEAHPSARLTDEIVKIIRRECARGVSQLALAERFGVRRRTINDVVRRQTWSHVA